MVSKSRFPLVDCDDRAELLGAVFGDGWVRPRGRRGVKVAVGVSDLWPQWHARVPQLFDAVFGRHSVCEKKGAGSRFFEYYVTTHDIQPLLGITSKYDEGGRLLPPPWVQGDEELLRRFLRGLVETDGCFSVAPDGTLIFTLSQKNDCLSAWFVRILAERGFPAYLGVGVASGVNQSRVSVRHEVQRLGEWLGSEKWSALVDRGFEPTTLVVDRRGGGVPVASRKAVRHKTIPVAEQEEWRRYRTLGASYSTIGLHFGRSNNVVMQATCDIVPVKPATAEELGLRPQPRIPRKVPSVEVEQWREAARQGDSARKIAKRFSRRASQVQDAVADIRFDMNIEKRRQAQENLAAMMTAPQGEAPWPVRQK